VYRRGVGVIVTHQLNPDAKVPEGGVIERLDVEVTVLPVDEHVGGAVVWHRSENPVCTVRDAHHNVACMRTERAADEAATLGMPGVPHGGAQLSRDESGEPILETFLPLIRERQVVGIGADPELGCWRGS
jgi:hypothetical protein